MGDLERSLDYYREAIGLGVLASENGRAALGTGGRELLVLVEEIGAKPETATPVSSTSPSCCPSASTSPAGSLTQAATTSP